MALDLRPTDRFVSRHIGPSDKDLAHMLATVKADSLDALIDATVPAAIRLQKPLNLPAALTEREMLDVLAGIAERNQVFRSFIGLGYHDTITPPVIQRNVLENPGWYTQYTPYQAEISQGRLEALLNFQTMVMDLTGLPIANASLLDEGTAAAEAMHVLWGAGGSDARNTFFVSDACHPQTIAVVSGRARAVGIDVTVGDERAAAFGEQVFGRGDADVGKQQRALEFFEKRLVDRPAGKQFRDVGIEDLAGARKPVFETGGPARSRFLSGLQETKHRWRSLR